MSYELILIVPIAIWLSYAGIKVIERWFDRSKKKTNSLF